MRVTKAEVIKTASDIADRNGLHNVSLKAIAENLGIRTPSLYIYKEGVRIPKFSAIAFKETL